MTALFHGTLTRRHFLGTSAAALAASALSSAAPAQGARFRRFEISDPGMPPRVLDSYKKGIREMLNRPPTDPRNWYRNRLHPCVRLPAPELVVSGLAPRLYRLVGGDHP